MRHYVHSKLCVGNNFSEIGDSILRHENGGSRNHIPEVAGSNPAPATKKLNILSGIHAPELCFICDSGRCVTTDYQNFRVVPPGPW